jgi:hypothetical protein
MNEESVPVWGEEEFEVKPKVRPYRIGDVVELDDPTRSYSLCPNCGQKNEGAPNMHTKIGEIHLSCPNKHGWLLTKEGKIEDINRQLF